MRPRLTFSLEFWAVLTQVITLAEPQLLPQSQPPSLCMHFLCQIKSNGNYLSPFTSCSNNTSCARSPLQQEDLGFPSKHRMSEAPRPTLPCWIRSSGKAASLSVLKLRFFFFTLETLMWVYNETWSYLPPPPPALPIFSSTCSPISFVPVFIFISHLLNPISAAHLYVHESGAIQESALQKERCSLPKQLSPAPS